jgi:3-methylcrotonyl-CoA carboxylase alpha subunit
MGYVGAGTVEFLLDPDHRFYFMEMNTRLQVEHPVTEMITGQDLVEWQLRVAAGEPVPCGQDDLAINGHAMEARIYAENPDTDFLPSTGTLSVLDPGRDRPWKRIDSGVCQGDTIHPYYDPMIAKLITWGEDRETARRRLERALAEFDIAGVTTNTGFLLKLIRLADFSAARLHTGIIPQNHDTLFDVTGSDAVEQEALAMATLYLAGHYGQGAEVGDPATPWVGGPWRLNLPGRVLGRFACGDREQEYTLYWSQGRWSGEIDGETRPLRLQPLGAARYHFLAGDSQQQASIYRVDNTLHLNLGGEQRQLTVVDPGRSDAELVTPSGSLNAPMPGSVIALNVSPGDSVNAGDALMVLEAMKMEHTISAPHDGVVQRLLFQPGDQVKEGDLLLELTDPESGDDA